MHPTNAAMHDSCVGQNESPDGSRQHAPDKNFRCMPHSELVPVQVSVWTNICKYMWPHQKWIAARAPNRFQIMAQCAMLEIMTQDALWTHSYLVCVTCMSQDLAGVLKAVFCGSRWVPTGGLAEDPTNVVPLDPNLAKRFLLHGYTRLPDSWNPKFPNSTLPVRDGPDHKVGAIQTIKTIPRDLCMHA